MGHPLVDRGRAALVLSSCCPSWLLVMHGGFVGGVKFSLGVHGLAQNRVQLVPSSTGFNDPNTRLGETSRPTNDLDGWSVESVTIEMLKPMQKDTTRSHKVRRIPAHVLP